MEEVALELSLRVFSRGLRGKPLPVGGGGGGKFGESQVVSGSGAFRCTAARGSGLTGKGLSWQHCWD